jgi:hypothetical protein
MNRIGLSRPARVLALAIVALTASGARGDEGRWVGSWATAAGQVGQELGRVCGGSAGEVVDLKSAREAGSNHEGIAVVAAHGREKPVLGDEPRDLVVFQFIAE